MLHELLLNLDIFTIREEHRRGRSPECVPADQPESRSLLRWLDEILKNSGWTEWQAPKDARAGKGPISIPLEF